MVESAKELRKRLYENKPVGSLWNHYVLSYPSVYITQLLVRTPITANQVTITMLVLGILGSAFLFMGHFALGIIILHLSVILDNVDGEIARYRKKTGLFGIYLDTIYHFITIPLMLFGFAFGTFNVYPNKLLLLFGFLSALFAPSIVMSAIADTIVTMRLRAGDTLPIRYKPKEVQRHGLSKKMVRGPLQKVYHFLWNIWSYPSNLLLLTILYLWEVYNHSYHLIPEYDASVWFFVIYGSMVAIKQLVSFIHNTRKNTVESSYYSLFVKK